MLASSKSRASTRRDSVRPGMANAFVADHVDRQSGRLWDSLDFKAGEELPEHRLFFDTPIGVPLPDGNYKMPFDTNMKRARSLHPPRCFLLERILITFSKSSVPEDISVATDSLMISLHILDKCFASSPICHMRSVKEPLSPIRICDFCRAVFVEQLQCPGCGARSFRLSTLGEFDTGQQFVLDLEPKKYIPPLTDFYVRLQIRRGTKFKRPLRIWCTFEGFEDLPVQ